MMGFGDHCVGFVDVDDLDDDVEHQPVADSDGDCICLAAVDGRLKLHSLVGRIVQPFMRL